MFNRSNAIKILSILTRYTNKCFYFSGARNKQCLTARIEPKNHSLKPTNKQTFATQDYVALCSQSYQGIRRSEIQRLIKHSNKKLIPPFLYFCKYFENVRRNKKYLRLILIFEKQTKQLSLDSTDVWGANTSLWV